jgi:uncharacterized membrane protein
VSFGEHEGRWCRQFGGAGHLIRAYEAKSVRMHSLEKINNLAEGFSEQLDKRKLLLLCGLSLVYLAGTCSLASRKLLWFDKFFTFYIAQVPSIADIWSALSTGADQIPPPFYLITRASLALFGVNHLAVRLPEVLGF